MKTHSGKFYRLGKDQAQHLRAPRSTKMATEKCQLIYEKCFSVGTRQTFSTSNDQAPTRSNSPGVSSHARQAGTPAVPKIFLPTCFTQDQSKGGDGRPPPPSFTPTRAQLTNFDQKLNLIEACITRAVLAEIGAPKRVLVCLPLTSNTRPASMSLKLVWLKIL